MRIARLLCRLCRFQQDVVLDIGARGVAVSTRYNSIARCGRLLSLYPAHESPLLVRCRAAREQHRNRNDQPPCGCFYANTHDSPRTGAMLARGAPNGNQGLKSWLVAARSLPARGLAAT